MSDITTSNFPTMGDSGIPHSIVNLSGAPSKYTIPAPRDKGGATNSEVQGAGTKANRSAALIREANGPSFKPVASMYAPNAACATDTMRNVRLVPSSLGNRDFWAKRAEGPRI